MNFGIIKKIFEIGYFIYNYISKYLPIKDLLRYIMFLFITTSLAVFISMVLLSPLVKTHTTNQVNNSQKRQIIREKAEDVRNQACKENNFATDKCPLLIRSFFVHNDMAWCMGHSDMLQSKEYLTTNRVSMIDDKCYQYLISLKQAIVSKKTLINYCSQLTEECIFKVFDSKFHYQKVYKNVAITCIDNNNNKFLLTNIFHDLIIGKDKKLTCFALVDGNKIQDFTEHLHEGIAKTIMNKILGNNLNYFDE
jgi:hypothetical protein